MMECLNIGSKFRLAPFLSLLEILKFKKNVFNFDLRFDIIMIEVKLKKEKMPS